MKKLLILLLLVIMFIPSVRADDITPNAKSAILIESNTGKVLYEKNINEKYAPASMTKMMSLLIIMENIDSGNLKMNEIIRVSKKASSMGGSQIFLEENEKMSVEDLLKGIAIGSANDATVALAERISGSEEAFVDLMNKKVKDLNLKNTNFKNATGLDEANHYSSAYDMSMIAKELVKHEKILEFSSIYETYLRQDTNNKFWLVNTNKLIRFYNGVDGLKTGYTEEAGYCLTATIKKGNMRLIAVVMGEPTSTTRNSEVSSLLDYGYNMYKSDLYLSKDKVLDKVNVVKGKEEYAEVIPISDVYVVNKKNHKLGNITYNLNINEVKAPIKEGMVIGDVSINEDDKFITKVNVTIKGNIDKANFMTLYLRNMKDILSLNI